MKKPVSRKLVKQAERLRVRLGREAERLMRAEGTWPYPSLSTDPHVARVLDAHARAGRRVMRRLSKRWGFATVTLTPEGVANVEGAR